MSCSRPQVAHTRPNLVLTVAGRVYRGRNNSWDGRPGARGCKEFLSPMIVRHEPRTLSANDQVLLAPWAVKTVFHARASVPAPLPWPAADLGLRTI